MANREKKQSDKLKSSRFPKSKRKQREVGAKHRSDKRKGRHLAYEEK